MLKLDDDWRNWSTYKTVTLALLYSQDLAKNIHRNAKPPSIIHHKHKEYLSSDTEFTQPLDPYVAQHYNNEMDAYLKNEGKGTLILYETLPPSVFQQISHLDTLRTKWAMLQTLYSEIHNAWSEDVNEKPLTIRLEDKWVKQRDLLHRLQTVRYQDGSVINHIRKIIELRSKLASYDIEITNVGLTHVLLGSLVGTRLELRWLEDESYDSLPHRFEACMEALFELEDRIASQ